MLLRYRLKLFFNAKRFKYYPDTNGHTKPVAGQRDIIRVRQVTQRYGITEAVVRYLEPRLNDGGYYTNAILSSNVQVFPAHLAYFNSIQTAKPRQFAIDVLLRIVAEYSLRREISVLPHSGDSFGART